MEAPMQIRDLIPLAEARVDLKSADCPCGLFVLRETAPTGLQPKVYDPVICLILQGVKETTSHRGHHRLAAGDLLVVSHDTPVSARITEASAARPYLALILPVNLATIRALSDQMTAQPGETGQISVMDKSTAGERVLETVARILSLAPGTEEARVMAPLLATELHYRLLSAPSGGMLRRLVSPTSQESRIARAIALIRSGHAEALRIEALAQAVGMGQSAFHAHFKSVTGTTPLQFQKDIRLTEANRLLEQGGLSVTEAGFRVGYESLTQFSREFSRKFGRTPRDALMRRAVIAAE
jgi:AraC-like DNA-binding protein